jgi:hypothetical protein
LHACPERLVACRSFDRVRLARQQALQEIGPAYDADQLSVAENGDAAHAMALHQRGDLAERRVLSGGHNVPGHDVGDMVRMRANIIARHDRAAAEQAL